MMDLMEWAFTLLEPVSGVLVFFMLAAALFGLSFVVSFFIAKFES